MSFSEYLATTPFSQIHGSVQPVLTLVIPMFCEEHRIEPTIKALAQWRSPVGSTEIVFVDDGSTDDTLGALDRSLRRWPLNSNCVARQIRLSHNQGKGAAVKAGVQAAHGQIIGFLDADLSASPDELSRAIDVLLSGGADVVLGSRSLEASDLIRSEGLYRRLGSRALNRVIRVMGLADVRDTQCGLKVFWAHHRDLLFGEQVCTRFSFDVEMLSRADRAGLRLVEMPVRWGRVDGSHVTPWRDGLTMLVDLGRIRAAIGRSTIAHVPPTPLHSAPDPSALTPSVA